MELCYLFLCVTCETFIFIYVTVAYSFSILSVYRSPLCEYTTVVFIHSIVDRHVGYFSLRPLWPVLLLIKKVEHIFICLLVILPYEFVYLFCLILCLVYCFFLFICRIFFLISQNTFFVICVSNMHFFHFWLYSIFM